MTPTNGHVNVSRKDTKLNGEVQMETPETLMPTSTELDLDVLIQEGVIQRDVKVAGTLTVTLRTLDTGAQLLVAAETEKLHRELYPKLAKLSDDDDAALLCGKLPTLKYAIVAINGKKTDDIDALEHALSKMDSMVSTHIYIEQLRMQTELSALLMAAVKKNSPS